MAFNDMDAMDRYIESKSDTFDKVGTYLISKACDSSTYPCEHTLINLRIGSTMKRNGLIIYEILKHWRMSHPHFEKYRTMHQHKEELMVLSNSLV